MCKKKVLKEYRFTAEEFTYMAKGFYESENFGRALSCLENAKDIFLSDRKNRKKEEMALCYYLYGCIMFRTYKNKEAKKAFRLAKRYYRRYCKNKAMLADCIVEESIFIEKSLFNEKKAIRRRKKALRILKRAKADFNATAKVNYYLGAIYYKKKTAKGDRLAEKYFCDALKQDHSPEYLYFAMGSLQFRLKKYRKALGYFLQSEKMRREMYCDTPYHMQLAEIYELIGDVYMLIELEAKAVSYYVQALEIYDVNLRNKDALAELFDCHLGSIEGLYKELLSKLYHCYYNLGDQHRADKYRKLWEKA